MSQHPPEKKTSATATFGVLLVGLLLASALGALAVGRMSGSKVVQTGPQIQVARVGQAGSRGSPPLAGLPALAQLPREFKLTDQIDQAFTFTSFSGKASIVNFVFTTCPMVCPLITRTMKGLERELALLPEWPSIQLLSLSVDPEVDTPAKLVEYAAKYEAQAPHWLFLTGQRDVIVNLIRDGFKLSINADSKSSAPIIHSEQFALVDGEGIVRGYYNPQETLGRNTLLKDAVSLAREYRNRARSGTTPPSH